MIITSAKALRIVSNHEVLKAVPELLAAVESYVATDRKIQAKKDCAGCGHAKHFTEVEKTAVTAIRSLSKDAINRLKTFLNTEQLYLNVPKPGAKGELIRLDN